MNDMLEPFVPDWQDRISRANQFLMEYAEVGEGFSVSYKTVKYHYFSYCRSLGLADWQYSYSEILRVLSEKSLVSYRDEQPPIVIGIRMKHPVGLPRFYNKGNRKGITLKDKEAVYAKLRSNGNMCAICGWIITEDDKVHIDHIIPLWNGGTNESSNLQAVHEKCNLVKG